MDKHDRVVVNVSCPGGCRGSVSLRRRGSSYGYRDFELRAGVARRLAIQVRSPRAFFGGRRSVRAILNTSVETASGLDVHETNRSVTVRR
jgi:hypothetical protein